SAIPTVRGNEGRTKTPMDYCGNTFRKARTSLAMIAETFRLSPTHSTTGPARHSGGEHRRKCLPTNYTQAHDTVLRRPVESALRAGVAVMDQPGIDAVIGMIAPPQRHLQCRRHHRGVLNGGGMPAHDRP